MKDQILATDRQLTSSQSTYADVPQTRRNLPSDHLKAFTMQHIVLNSPIAGQTSD